MWGWRTSPNRSVASFNNGLFQTLLHCSSSLLISSPLRKRRSPSESTGRILSSPPIRAEEKKRGEFSGAVVRKLLHSGGERNLKMFLNAGAAVHE